MHRRKSPIYPPEWIAFMRERREVVQGTLASSGMLLRSFGFNLNELTLGKVKQSNPTISVGESRKHCSKLFKSRRMRHLRPFDKTLAVCLPRGS